METTTLTQEKQAQVFVKAAEKPHYLLKAVAVVAGLAALVLLFLPWFEINIAGFSITVGALQMLLQSFNINGQIIAFPILSKIFLLLAILSLVAALFAFITKKYLTAGVLSLLGCIFLIVMGASFAPLNLALQNATGVSLGIEDRAYSIASLQTLAFLASVILAICAFVLFSAERFAKRLFMVSAMISIAMVFLITAYLVALGLPAILEIGPLNFLFGTQWKPTHSTNPQFGILNMILASIFGTLGAVVLGVPIGIFTAIFLAEIAPKWLRAIVRPAVELLAGIPSVIYGFFALQLIVPAVQKLFKLPSGATLLSAIIVLAIMILPTIVTTAETGLRAVPEIYKEASLALGASHIRTIFKVLLPAARATVLSGVILGVGRAIGETMAIIMVAGGMAKFPTILGSVRPLTVGIVMEMSYAAGLHRESLFAIGLVLFVFIMVVNFSFTKLSKQGVQMDG